MSWNLRASVDHLFGLNYSTQNTMSMVFKFLLIVCANLIPIESY